MTEILLGSRDDIHSGGGLGGDLLFAVSRFDPDNGAEYLIAFNTSTAPIDTHVQVDVGSRDFVTLAGAPCAARAVAPGSLSLRLPPLGYSLCAVRPSRSLPAKSPE